MDIEFELHNLLRTVHTTLGIDRNFTDTLGTFFGRRIGWRFFARTRNQIIHRLNNKNLELTPVVQMDIDFRLSFESLLRLIGINRFVLERFKNFIKSRS